MQMRPFTDWPVTQDWKTTAEPSVNARELIAGGGIADHMQGAVDQQGDAWLGF
jgi:hypothetical protein